MSRTSRPPPEPAVIQEGACTDVLSLVQRCASSTDGAISQAGGLSLEAGASPLVSPQVELFLLHQVIDMLGEKESPVETLCHDVYDLRRT